VGNVVTIEANKLVTSSVTGASYTAATGAINLALVTANGDATTAGTEVTGGSYARQPTTGSWGSASAGAITNSISAINFTGMPGTITIVGIELWDSAGTPVRRWFGALTANKTVNPGDTVTFATSSISISLT
jgi:hypothetical protein